MFEGERTTHALKDGRRGGLVVGLRNTSTGQTSPLEHGARRWVLGSEPSCDLHVADPYVSHVHCVLERRPDGAVVVRDRESRNGTYIDGNAVEGAELRVGSYLSVGRTTLIAVAKLDGGGERPRAIEMLRGHHPAMRSAI